MKFIFALYAFLLRSFFSFILIVFFFVSFVCNQMGDHFTLRSYIKALEHAALMYIRYVSYIFSCRFIRSRLHLSQKKPKMFGVMIKIVARKLSYKSIVSC